MAARALTVATMLLLAVAGEELKDVKQPAEAVYFSKSTEVVVMGCFEKREGSDWDVFVQVAREINRHGGVGMGSTISKGVWSRYLEADTDKPPAVVVWTSYDPDTGRIRKGKKTKLVLSGPFKFESLYKFLLRESLPLVLRLPANDGPDFQKRQMLGMQSGFPKLFFFVNKKEVEPDSVTEVALLHKQSVICVYYVIDANTEDDEGAQVMKSLGMEAARLPAVAMASSASVKTFQGDVSSAAELSLFVKGFVQDEGEFVPSPRAHPSKGGGKKSSKSSSRKKTAPEL
eukprot:762833-Hanusia_phi.AAC.3